MSYGIRFCWPVLLRKNFCQCLDTIMEYELGEELNEMCNLSEAIEEKAIKKGKRQGRKEGRKEGILLAKKVMKLSEEGMNEAKIAQLCGITPEEVHEILES